MIKFGPKKGVSKNRASAVQPSQLRARLPRAHSYQAPPRVDPISMHKTSSRVISVPTELASFARLVCRSRMLAAPPALSSAAFFHSANFRVSSQKREGGVRSRAQTNSGWMVGGASLSLVAGWRSDM